MAVDTVMALPGVRIGEQAEEQEHIADAHPVAGQMTLRRARLPEPAVGTGKHRIVMAQIMRADPAARGLFDQGAKAATGISGAEPSCAGIGSETGTPSTIGDGHPPAVLSKPLRLKTIRMVVGPACLAAVRPGQRGKAQSVRELGGAPVAAFPGQIVFPPQLDLPVFFEIGGRP